MTCRTLRASFRIVPSGSVKKTGARSRTSTLSSMEWNGGQLLLACWRVTASCLACLWPFSTGGRFSGPMARDPVIGNPAFISLPRASTKPSSLREGPARIHLRRSDDGRRGGWRAGWVGGRRLNVVVLVGEEDVFQRHVGEQPLEVLGVALGEDDRDAGGDTDCLAFLWTQRRRPHANHVQVAENGAGRDVGAHRGEQRRVDGRDGVYVVAGRDVSRHTLQLV